MKVSILMPVYNEITTIMDVIELVRNVKVEKAIIIVDDYDFFSTGSKTAVDEFIEEKNSTETIYKCFVPNTQYGHFIILTRIG